jgi:hypothetical protein
VYTQVTSKYILIEVKQMYLQKQFYWMLSVTLLGLSGAMLADNGQVKEPPELRQEDPTHGEIADVYIDIAVPVHREYRYYNRGYYRREYPFYYMDDPYYYNGPGYFRFYGRDCDDDDDACHHHHHHHHH